jgi:peptidoglycan/LPS O-acetylase OafA/YrhL
MLRGIAVLMVMLSHLPFSMTGLGTASGELFPPERISKHLAHGQYGVQLFLVISGYCIHTRWARTADRGCTVAFLPFWKRRLTRLYPPYVVAIGFCLLLLWAGSRFGGVPMPSPAQMAIDVTVLLLLLQNFTKASESVGNGPFWSLALEEQLYLLYFPLLSMRRKFGWRVALPVVCVVNLAWVAVGFFVPESFLYAWVRMAPQYWFAWALGALAAEAHHKVLVLPAWTRSLWLFAASLALGLWLPRPARDLVVTCSFFFLLQAAVHRESTASGRPFVLSRAMLRLGHLSYGVYLAHNPAFIVGKRIMVMAHLPPLVILPLRFACGLLAGYALYRIVEAPSMRLAQKIPVPLRPG